MYISDSGLQAIENVKSVECPTIINRLKQVEKLLPSFLNRPILKWVNWMN
ncbi:hypothetical protein IQ270_16040 [Microcoleus sp. LEGE 07076]|nr:hypothetical protein [Microcoleus sp. LEGE 07076]MBE9186153.1 hypothetical protein [Microcoleus sp. LEGE 07076]